MNRTVILGKFGGLAAAQRLDHILRYDEDIDVTPISDTSFLLYTPMLADVAGATIEPLRRAAAPHVAAQVSSLHCAQQATATMTVSWKHHSKRQMSLSPLTTAADV